MHAPVISEALVARLHEMAGADRWALPAGAFRDALQASAARAFPDRAPTTDEIERHFSSLHLDDLALATACAAGIEAAWEHFIAEYRPVLERAARAIDPTGNAIDLAGTIIGDLYGTEERDGVRQSLFRYFHGRSRLGTWLRAVLAQRHIDRLRVTRRQEPMPEAMDSMAAPGSEAPPDPERARFVGAMRAALASAIAGLEPRDRLRLRCYYVQDMTLAAIGRMLKEHEATVSRHLTRTRSDIRASVEDSLHRDHGMDERAVAECLKSVSLDAGGLDLVEFIGHAGAGKNTPQDRSK